MSLAPWLAAVREDLYGRVLPFWLTHSPDRVHGGFFNCLDEDGAKYDTKKYVWLQGRQVWMFSKLFNELSDEQWVEQYTARHGEGAPARELLRSLAVTGANFLSTHARAADGTFAFCLSEEGAHVAAQRKMFSACFYVMGLSECARATGDDAMRKDALATFTQVLVWSRDPTLLGRPVLPCAPSYSTLAVPMILLNLIQELQQGMSAEEQVEFYPDEKAWCVTEIRKHVKLDLKLVLENVGPDGEYDDTCPEGRLVNPGHAIECGWFLLDYAVTVGDATLQEEALQIIDMSFEGGWDPEYGGLYYFLDSKGYSPVQLEWNMKLWWPHCEALIAFAYAYKVTKNAKYEAQFVRVAEYTFSHFVDKTHGEWYGYLDRAGAVTHRFKGGPYKGCFHVPRALFMVEKLLASLE